MVELPAGLLPVVAGLFGLVLGSFLNVVVWRVPRGESIVAPPSACPRCHHPIAPRDNIPVLSWLLLRGRCRHCGEPVSVRYPLVESATAAAFVTVTLWSGQHWATIAWLYLAAVSIALALIDLDHQRLPNVIVLPSAVVTTILLAVAAWNPGGAADWGHLLRALLGAGALFIFYAAAATIYPAGMGWGDVKLAAVVGLGTAWAGWGALFIGTLTGFVIGAVVGIAVMLATKQGRKTRVPFGPWMLAGMWLGIIAGQRIWDAYINLLVG